MTGIHSSTQGVVGPGQQAPISSKRENEEKLDQTVVKVVKLPIPTQTTEPLGEHRITPLIEATKLAKEIQQTWDSLEIEELAEKIIDLETKVSKIEEMSPEAEKVKKLAKRLHFQFVHPVIIELDESQESEENPLSFVGSIRDIAGQIIKKGSFVPFCELSEIQQREITRLTQVGG